MKSPAIACVTGFWALCIIMAYCFFERGASIHAAFGWSLAAMLLQALIVSALDRNGDEEESKGEGTSTTSAS